MPVCGNPLIAAVYTLGLLPTKLPDPCIFTYDLEQGGKHQVLSHRLALYRRYSIWEWPLKLYPEDKVYARALATSSVEDADRKQ